MRDKYHYIQFVSDSFSDNGPRERRREREGDKIDRTAAEQSAVDASDAADAQHIPFAHHKS